MIVKSFIVLLILTSFYSCSVFNFGNSEKFQHNFDVDSIDIKVSKHVLDNGLTVLIIENSYLPVFSYYTFFKVGGKNEYKGIVGGSHFLEHMMFKGSKKFGMGEFDHTIEANGGSTNAFTNMDLTVYHNDLPSDSLAKIIELEADRMTSILLDPEAFEKERQVILEERKLRYENQPSGILYLEMMKEMFKGTPYGRSVIGESSEIKEITIETMRDYYKTFYVTNNAVLVIAGGIDAAKAISMVKTHYGMLKSSEKLNQVRSKVLAESKFENEQKNLKEIRVNASSQVPIFLYAFHGEPMTARKSLALDILSYILGAGDSSYLTQEFVKNRRPMLTTVYASNQGMQNGGVFVIGGELMRGVKFSKFERRLRNSVKDSCQKAVNERSVSKTKNQFMVELYNGLETNAGMARFIGMAEVLYGDYTKYKKELEIYADMTADEVKEICEDTFSKQGSLVSVWNRHPRKK